MKEYVFKIGNYDIIVGAETEKEALQKLVDEKWEMIDREAFIELYGELTEKRKLKDLSDEEE